MLKLNEANPLAVFGLRRVEHCPPHFSKFMFDAKASEKVITDWVFEHLSGRFYYGDWYDEANGRIDVKRCVAFEEPGEASYFALIIDTINKHSAW